MAEPHIPGDKNKDLKLFFLNPSKFGSQISASEEPRNQNLWPRSLARKWTLMLFGGTCLLYCARMTMPVCAISMASQFHWSKIDSGIVLGGFFWGYCLTQILGGYVSDKVGGERVLLLSAASWSLISAATPLLSRLGSHQLLSMTVARILLGILQGVFFPSLASLCSRRVPEGDRGFLMSTMVSGSHLGTLLAGGMGSAMLDRYGWESMFYLTGALAAVWALTVWLCLIKGEIDHSNSKTINKTPAGLSRKQWLKLFRKPPVWAMVFAHMCICSTSYTLLSWLPTYFKESFPRAPAGAYNMVPWLTAIPSALAGGYVSDILIARGYAVLSIRKIMQFCAMGASSAFLLPLSGHVKFTSAVIFISASVGFSTFNSGGASVNVHDLAPTCAGALYGFMNMMGAFMGLLLVSFSGYLIEVTLSWATVFSLITLVNTIGLGIFLIFGDARRLDEPSSCPLLVV